MSVFGETQTYGAFDVDNLFRKKNTPNSYKALLETLRPNKTRPNQTRTHQTDSSTTHLSVHSPHGIRICIKRKKIIYGKFFDFCAEKCVFN